MPDAPASTNGRKNATVLGVAIVGALLLAWTRIDGIDQSFWHDEVYAALHYVQPGPREILFGTYVPNDHVLYNLLSWATVKLLGDTESSYRLWSTLPALAAVGVLGWWVWRRVGAWTATGFAILVLTSPLHLDLARQARGYGLTFLAIALLIVAADRADRGGGTWAWAGFAAAGVVGAATLPVFVLAFLGVAAALATRRELWRPCALAVAAAGVALLVLYAPLLGDILDNADQPFGLQLPWYGLFTAPVEQLLAPSAELVLREPTPTWADLLIVAVVLGGVVRLVNEDRGRLAVLLGVPVLFTYLVLTVGRFYVLPRFASFLLLPLLALAAAGLAAPVEAVARRPAARAAAAVAAGAIVAVAVLATVRVVQSADAQAELPIENFEEVGEVVDGTGIQRVVTNSVRPEGLWYYLGRDRVEIPPADQLKADVCDGPAPFVYVDHPFSAGFDTAPVIDTACLARRGATLVQVPQRPERGSVIGVWIVTGPPAGGGERGR